MDRPSFLSGVVRWLRAGYPEGVPSRDYQPLLALLRRQLTEDEIRQVALELVDTRAPEPINRIDVGVEISKVTQELPRQEDVDRVRQTLKAAEWPFDDEPLAPPDRPENPEEPS
ncbi:MULTISPECIES: DUF3349 domain-containing protein [Gordonia]|uniref:DUF3349 domain-containing protein n=2 Tax=Gordonia TaxID=2053 RepID=L7LE52_9ACTN|nr:MULTISPECIES: DUF3349 domain-containing protein [Gordonia]AUH69998.1 DUF3349 domain-containing protein [Gordonia sp. YC-JH1]KJR08389.1 hypothetical protein UG54_07715 [Gordonia sihwensis]KXT58599.1 hypothetical protein Y710_03495 [Gordonia sp. QH-12]MBY4569214.1 hypothetical protein [Gordonia sihwensis]WFN93318.1 DUF3349 domain-containing protein [Gordonia sihwensis]